MEMRKENNIVSIKILKGSQLPDRVRAPNNIKNDDFAEVIVERNSAAKPKVKKIEGAPSSGFIEAIKKSTLYGKKF